MTTPTERAVNRVAITTLVLTALAIAVLYVLFVRNKETQALSRRCQTIPTAVAAWGLSIHSTPSGLYFCYQQGAGQGMTEVVCTPMKDCKP